MKNVLITMLMLCSLARAARAETEWVLILDNSGSMSVGSVLTTTKPDGSKTVENQPPKDPHRVAVIATLIFRAFLDKDDKLTILTFKCCDDPPPGATKRVPKPGLYETLPNDITTIRDLAFDELTPFTGPMRQAKEILGASKADKKILLLVTDGFPGPEDPLTSADAIKILGLGTSPPPFEVISIGIAPDAATAAGQKEFLGTLGKLVPVENPPKLVSEFTAVYADSIRSKPESGTLQAGGTFEFKAPKYVSEVLVAVASVNRMGTFTAKLAQDGKDVPPIDGGDSGCAKYHPDRTPCFAYQAFKAKKDTDAAESWTLSAGDAKGPLAYGVILRYDLKGEIVSLSDAKAGEEKEVIARLTYRGKPFNDADFFKADGFEAHVVIEGTEAPLELRADGSFVGKIKVPKPGPQTLIVRFRNKWLTVTVPNTFIADAWMPLDLKVGALDFGSWTGEREESKRCVDIDFSKSTNADKVPLEMFGKDLPSGLTIEAPRGPATGNKAKVCVVAPGCCDAYKSDGGKPVLVIRGENAHYHPEAIEVPLKFAVAATPFITCWWRVIAGVIGTIMFIIIAYGFIKPFDFGAQEVIKLASKEAGLPRATGRRLRELPGGRRGFYRDAKVGFDGSGGAVKPGATASLVFKATKSDAVVVSKTTIEHKDPRTRKWEPIKADDGPIYLRRNVVYRIGEMYFQLG